MIRPNYVILVVGRPRTGKTTYILELIKRATKAVLVYDLNNEEKYWSFPQMPFEKLLSWKHKGKYRLFHDDEKELLEALNANAYNAMLVLEDATAYIQPNVQPPVKRMLVSRRHRNLDIVFTFHSFNRVPPLLFEMSNYIVIGKTNDPIHNNVSIKKVPNFERVREVWERVQSHPSEYYRETVATNA